MVARLSLLDSSGYLIVQSEGTSTVNANPSIDEHIVQGTFYLEVQSLSGSGLAILSSEETPASTRSPRSRPRHSTPTRSPSAISAARKTLDYATPSGVYLGQGDGTFAPPIDAANIDPNGDQISSIVAANFDGQVDLVVADETASTVSILTGDGRGSVGAQSRS